MPSYLPVDVTEGLAELRSRAQTADQLDEYQAQQPQPDPTPDPPQTMFTDDMKARLMAPFNSLAQKAQETQQQASMFTDDVKSRLLAPFQSLGQSPAPSNGISPAQRGPDSGTQLDMSSPDAYKQTLMANAQEVADKYGLPAKIIASIPIQEAGYGGSELSRRANNLFCYDQLTEVATATGWKSWADVTHRDLLTTWNPETKRVEYQAPTKLVREQYNGPMYRVATGSVDLLVTPEHRMWVRLVGDDVYRFMPARDISDHPVEYLSLQQVSLVGGVSGVIVEPMASLRAHVGHVVSLSSLKQMIRANAGRIVAMMQDLLLRRQAHVVVNFPRDAMRDGTIASPASPNYSVTEFIQRCRRPNPALAKFRSDNRTVLVHLSPESDVQRLKVREPAGAVTPFPVTLFDQVAVSKKTATTTLTYPRNGGNDRLTRHRTVTPFGVTPSVVGATRGHFNHSNFTSSNRWEDYSGMVYCATVPNGLVIVRRNGKIVVSGNSIKGEGPAGSEHFGNVWEVQDGQNVSVPADFRKYNTPAESFEDFAKLITESPRYADAVKVYRDTGDQDAFIRAVNDAGYATDQTWANKVSAIAREMPDAPAGRIPALGQSTSQAFDELTPNQFTSGAELSAADANAACGPAAAVAFARRTGRNPTLDEAVQLAKSVGWTTEGMAGPESEVQLLQKMGVAAHMEAPDAQKMAVDVSRGNPVSIDTPGHYFVAERYDPSSGKFDFGNSARVLKASGGNTWYTLDEVANLGFGAPRTAIYMDNPETPAPSVVAGRSQQKVENAPEIAQAVDQVAARPTQPKYATKADAGTQRGGMAAFDMSGGALDQASSPPPVRDSWAQEPSTPSPDPEAGAYTSSPAGTDVTPSSTQAAFPSAQSDGVEPAAPADAAPPSGEPTAPWHRVGQAIGDAIQGILGAGGKPDMQQAASDIQQRQATVPGSPQADQLAQEPMPLQQIGNEIGQAARDNPPITPQVAKEITPGLTPQGNADFYGGFQRADDLFKKQIDGTITPDEERELQDLQGKQGQIIGANAPEAGGGAPRKPVVTPDGWAFLSSVDEGGVPMGMTSNLRRIAQENGIDVTANTTPQDVIQGLYSKISDSSSLKPPGAGSPDIGDVPGPTPDPRLNSDLHVSRRQMIQEMDQAGAPDAEYKNIISTASRDLKPGESARDAAVRLWGDPNDPALRQAGETAPAASEPATSARVIPSTDGEHIPGFGNVNTPETPQKQQLRDMQKPETISYDETLNDLAQKSGSTPAEVLDRTRGWSSAELIAHKNLMDKYTSDVIRLENQASMGMGTEDSARELVDSKIKYIEAAMAVRREAGEAGRTLNVTKVANDLSHARLATTEYANVAETVRKARSQVRKALDTGQLDAQGDELLGQAQRWLEREVERGPVDTPGLDEAARTSRRQQVGQKTPSNDPVQRAVDESAPDGWTELARINRQIGEARIGPREALDELESQRDALMTKLRSDVQETVAANLAKEKNPLTQEEVDKRIGRSIRGRLMTEEKQAQMGQGQFLSDLDRQLTNKILREMKAEESTRQRYQLPALEREYRAALTSGDQDAMAAALQKRNEAAARIDADVRQRVQDELARPRPAATRASIDKSEQMKYEASVAKKVREELLGFGGERQGMEKSMQRSLDSALIKDTLEKINAFRSASGRSEEWRKYGQELLDKLADTSGYADIAVRQNQQKIADSELRRILPADAKLTDELRQQFGNVDISDQRAVGQFIRNLDIPMANVPMWERVLNARVASMLSGTSGILNLANGAFATAMRAGPERQAAALSEVLVTRGGRTRPRVAAFSDTGEEIDGLISGLKPAINDFAETFKTGIATRPLRDMRSIRTDQFSGPLFKGLNYVGRFFGAGDDFLNTLNLSMAMRAEAAGEGRATGAGGAQDVLNSLIDHPDVLPRSQAQANRITLQERLGDLARGINVLRGNPIGRFLVPFFNSNASIVRQGFMELGPQGLIGAQKAANEGDHATAAFLRGRAVVGSGLMLLGAALNQKGLLYVRDKDNSDRYIEEQGQGKTSGGVRIGDVWWGSSVLGAYAVPLMFGAAVNEAVQDGMKEADAQETMDRFATAWKAGSNVLADMAQMALEMAALRGVTQLISAAGDPSTNIERYLSGSVASFLPYGGALGVAARGVDPTLRDPRNVAEQLLTRIPVASKDVPPRLGPLGEERMRVSGGAMALAPVYAQPANDNQIYKTFLAEGVSLNEPPDSVSVGPSKLKVSITPDEQRIWKRAYGEFLSQYADDFSAPDWGAIDGEHRKDFMDAAKGHASTYARQVLLLEMDKNPSDQERRFTQAERERAAANGR